MLRVDLPQAKSGMRLALPVMNPNAADRVLLKVGFKLTEPILAKLDEVGVKSLWVRYPSLEALSRFVDLESLQVQRRVVTEIARTFDTMQGDVSAKMRYDDYARSIEGMINHLVTHPATAVFLGDIADGEDDLLRHSSSVAYLSLLLGLKLESYVVKERKHVDPIRAKELINLGVGAMLHDVGVLLLDEEVRQRYRKTGDELDPAWREHPAIGYRHVHGQIEPTAATIVLNHHQRADGSGYVGRGFPVLSDKAMHVYARIVAVADQFDRVRRPVGLPDQPTVWALTAMLSEPERSRFDPVVLRALIEAVPAYPPGTIVKLTDGRYAVVLDHNPAQPCRPLVQVIPAPAELDPEGATPPGVQIDLGKRPASLAVAEVNGHDVHDLNFDQSLIVPLLKAA